MFFFKNKHEIKEEVKAKPQFQEIGLDELINYVKKVSGIDMEPKRDVFLKKAANFALENELYDYNELKRSIISDQNLYQDFINLITVNETYFFREKPQLEMAVKMLKTFPSPTRVLCAPCSSGEEIYSLIMLAKENFCDLEHISFVGIDINSEIIQKAKEAKYSARSLHRLSSELIDKYFIHKDDMYEFKKIYGVDVKFEVINIFDDKLQSLGKFDEIFSRNMMIYFDNDYKLKCVKAFSKLLKSNGKLFAGHADLIPENPYFKLNTTSRMYFDLI